MKARKVVTSVFDGKGKLKKSFKYIPCGVCGMDVKVTEEAIGATCYLCFMEQANFEAAKGKLPLTSLYSVNDIIKMLEEKTIGILRERLGITHRKMAGKLGLSKSVYFRCESARKISQNIVDKVRETLELEYRNNNENVGQGVSNH